VAEHGGEEKEDESLKNKPFVTGKAPGGPSGPPPGPSGPPIQELQKALGLRWDVLLLGKTPTIVVKLTQALHDLLQQSD